MPQVLEFLVANNLRLAPVLLPGFPEPEISESAKLIFPVNTIVTCQVPVLVPINLARRETVVAEFEVTNELAPRI